MKVKNFEISFEDMPSILEDSLYYFVFQGQIFFKVKNSFWGSSGVFPRFAKKYLINKIDSKLGQLRLDQKYFRSFAFQKTISIDKKSILNLRLTDYGTHLGVLIQGKKLKTMVKINDNALALFKKAIFMEKEGAWQCIEIIFTIDGKLFRHKYFAPSSYKQRGVVNKELRHLYETITGEDYEDLEFQGVFEIFAREFCKKINKYHGQSYYVKVLPQKNFKFLGLGFEIPFVSLRPDLEWGEDEELRLDAYNEMESTKEEGSWASSDAGREVKLPPPRTRGEDDLPF